MRKRFIVYIILAIAVAISIYVVLSNGSINKKSFLCIPYQAIPAHPMANDEFHLGDYYQPISDPNNNIARIGNISYSCHGKFQEINTRINNLFF